MPASDIPHPVAPLRDPLLGRCSALLWISLGLVGLMLGFMAGAVSADPVIWKEEFESDPLEGSWKSTGATELFHWDREHGNLQITWDSSKTNSYFYRKLPMPLGLEHDFSARFDLLASKILAGVNPDKSGTFQMAAGFLNLNDALRPDFVRGSGTGSPNLMEWNYFPDTGFGETFSSAVVASNGTFQAAMQFPFPLKWGEWHRVELKYEAALRRVSLVVTSASLGRLVVGPVTLNHRFPGFALDAFSFSSYSEEGQDPEYGGSIWASAIVDHVELEFPATEILSILALRQASDSWWVRLNVHAGVTYRLMRSDDLKEWVEVSRAKAPETGEWEMQDPQGAGTVRSKAFYRVESQSP